jgi:hypothetical protein
MEEQRFLEKRIQDQIHYMSELTKRYDMGYMSYDRYAEVSGSAYRVFCDLQDKLGELKDKIVPEQDGTAPR